MERLIGNIAMKHGRHACKGTSREDACNQNHPPVTLYAGIVNVISPRTSFRSQHTLPWEACLTT